MDPYLPTDYLQLREELSDWRDGQTDREAMVTHVQDEPVDPSWQTL